MKKIKIILAGNHEIWWDGLSELLGKTRDMEVISNSYDAVDAINKTNLLSPDILLIDDDIEGGDCSEVVNNIGKLNPQIGIVIVIKPYKNMSLSSSVKSRAKAYIDKDITLAELESCIRHVAKGEGIVISPTGAEQLLRQIAFFGNTVNTKAGHGSDVGLSKREKEVLSLLAKQGTTNKEIAQSLHITENTVKAHLSSILEKMQVDNRQQAVIQAREKGMVAEDNQ
jgi:two-component system response regulator DegU